jgi:hypothetical protein
MQDWYSRRRRVRDPGGFGPCKLPRPRKRHPSPPPSGSSGSPSSPRAQISADHRRQAQRLHPAPRAWVHAYRYGKSSSAFMHACMLHVVFPSDRVWRTSSAGSHLGLHRRNNPYYIKRAKLRRAEGLHRHQDLHCIKSDYIDPNINVKLYDYIKLQARLSSSSTSPTQTSPRSISIWSFAAAAYDKTRRCRDLWSPPPPTTRPAAAVISITAAAYDKTRRRRRTPAAAA